MLVEVLQEVLATAAPIAATVGVITTRPEFHNWKRLRQLEIVMRFRSTFG